MSDYQELLEQIRSDADSAEHHLDEIRMSLDKLEQMDSLALAADNTSTASMNNVAATALERMEGRRSGMKYATPEEDDIQALIDMYRRWRANR